MRKDLGGSMPGLQKSRSCSSLDGSTVNSQNSVSTYNNYLTVHVSLSGILVIYMLINLVKILLEFIYT